MSVSLSYKSPPFHLRLCLLVRQDKYNAISLNDQFSALYFGLSYHNTQSTKVRSSLFEEDILTVLISISPQGKSVYLLRASQYISFLKVSIFDNLVIFYPTHQYPVPPFIQHLVLGVPAFELGDDRLHLAYDSHIVPRAA